MKKAIYIRLVALSFVAVLICSVISAMTFAVYTHSQAQQWLTKLTLSAAENYKHTVDIQALSIATGNNRVTIIAPDGNVLADSDLAACELENHADREEVQHARAGSVYITLRESASLGEKYMYASTKAGDGNIIRLAHGYSGVLYNFTAQLPAMLGAIFATLILALFLAGRFTKAVISPLETMLRLLSVHEYEKLSDTSAPHYEIEKIIKSLQRLLHKITESNCKLQREREKTQYILSNMAEGFVLLDDKKNILLCNNSAQAFFSCNHDAKLENIYSLTRNQIIMGALQAALESGQASMFDLTLKEGLIVNVYISPSRTAEAESGATMLLVDVTAEKQLEQQKRDFFSNASHELKTPITSILGFSEMLNKGMIKSEQEQSDTMRRIETEAKRMSELIGDILTISKLESNRGHKELTMVNLAQTIKEAVSAVSPLKDDTAIELNTDLDDILYLADKRQMYELCVNLIENAVKYNKPNGTVDISLKKKGGNLIFTVKDTGIGIPVQYQSRVFERFYRVDCGRDKKIGGTGLGLSIVKHITSIYGGKISLQSKQDNGTTITVTLPKANPF